MSENVENNKNQISHVKTDMKRLEESIEDWIRLRDQVKPPLTTAEPKKGSFLLDKLKIENIVDEWSGAMIESALNQVIGDIKREIED